MTEQVTCSNCNGRAYVVREGQQIPCGSCGGRGWVKR